MRAKAGRPAFAQVLQGRQRTLAGAREEELELDEPPPPEDELLLEREDDDELDELDDDELLDDEELDDEELLELDELPPPVEDEDDWVELDDVVGLVGESVPQAARRPTPARAIPPERIFRKTRRSSRWASSFGFNEWFDIRLTSGMDARR